MPVQKKKLSVKAQVENDVFAPVEESNVNIKSTTHRNHQKKIIFIIAVVLIIVGASSWFIIKKNAENFSPYSAVYLTSGDILIGKLSMGSSPTLRNAWIITHGTDPAATQSLSVVPFKNTPIAPIDTININRDQILFWANLRNDSPLAKQLESTQ